MRTIALSKQFEQYTDDDIIHRIVEGEISLYEILIRRYNPFLYKIGRTYDYNHQDTEDLMQETYVSAYYSLPEFAHRASFKTWLTKIMLHHCYQKKQKFSFQRELPVNNVSSEKSNPMFHNDADAERAVVNKELDHVLENALIQIPRDYRMVFTLREINGLSVAETAEAVGSSESNVKVRLNRAKTMLRVKIEKMYSPEEIFDFHLRYCDGMVVRVYAVINNSEVK
ncbi:MAG: sigma-70 family RNA polymerase sigma factor [Sediminibacterium sp.]